MLKKNGFVCMMTLFLLLLGSAQVKAEFKVYDANGQYLGILVSLKNHYTPYIYIPSLQAIFKLKLRDDGNAEIYPDPLLKIYINNTCSGIGYTTAAGYPFLYITVDDNGNLFLINPEDIKSFKINSLFTKAFGNKCVSLKTANPYIESKITNIIPLTPFSETKLPFKLPIKLPLRLEYVPGGFDISGDGKIGLEEAIYSLQVAAGLRVNPNAK